MTETTTVLNKTERPNSIQFRLGGVGSEVKIYFDTAQDLDSQLSALNKLQDVLSSKIISLKTSLSKSE